MTYMVRPLNKAQDKAVKAVLDAMQIPYEKTKEESPYNREFVEKIVQSKKDFEEGHYEIIKIEDLWK